MKVLKLFPFQRQFIREATKPGIDTAVLSLPRGNSKSYIAACILTRFLTPGDPIHQPGKEAVLLSGSIQQSRIVFNFCRMALEPTGEYRFIDSVTRVGIVHKSSNTRLRVHGSNSKTAFGMVGVPFCVWDEPGVAEIVGGNRLWDSVLTSQGKPNSPLTAILIGTVAPATAGWWPELVAAGTSRSTYVQALQGDPKKWDQWNEIRRVNPLMSKFAESRAVLLEERDAARRDSRLKARFLSYRLNVPTADESEVLLTVSDWELLIGRDVPPRSGRPICGVDIGRNRAWSAAVAVWQNGRTEALAVAPGIPSIADQEKRDHVAAGLYQKLVETGTLQIADGLRVPPVAQLVDAVRENWGLPASMVADRFQLDDLKDALPAGVRLVCRVTRWSEATFDIRALRKFAVDGPFAVAELSRPLIGASLAVAMVKNDDAGSVRLVKRETNNQARDDISSALILVAGSFERASAMMQRRPGAIYRGMAG